MCKYWTTREELSGLVSRSMIQLIKKHPAIGWVRADKISNEETLAKMTQLYEENRAFKESEKTLNLDEKLAQGYKVTMIKFTMDFVDNGKYGYANATIKVSYNFLLKEIGSYLIEAQSIDQIERLLNVMFKKIFKNYNKCINMFSDENIKISKCKFDVSELLNSINRGTLSIQRCSIEEQSLQDVKVQLLALNYIDIIHTNTSSKYFLTEHGKKVLYHISAKVHI